jgi:hypothetical protein
MRSVERQLAKVCEVAQEMLRDGNAVLRQRGRKLAVDVASDVDEMVELDLDLNDPADRQLGLAVLQLTCEYPHADDSWLIFALHVMKHELGNRAEPVVRIPWCLNEIWEVARSRVLRHDRRT